MTPAASQSQVLLVADEAVGQLLAGQLGQAFLTVQPDPYEALEAMRTRSWPAILLGAWQADFDDLCRASRRLARESKILALCDPSSEPQVRRLVGAELDDYFIFPPSRADLAGLRKMLSPPVPVAAPAPDPVSISPAAMVRLVEAARGVSTLQESIAEIVSTAIHAPARWVDGDQMGTDKPLLVTGGGNSGQVLASDKLVTQLTPSESAFIGAMQQIVPALMESAARFESLHRLAITDHLTGAYNRRYFYHLTDQILQRAQSTGSRVCLLLYDIDNFKQYNDAYSYAVGDEILRQTANLMRQISRSHDIVARIGGDEFAVLFWDHDQPRSAESRPLKTAADLAERFRQAVNHEAFPLLGPQAVGTLTISGGLATFPRDGGDVRQLLRAADNALKIGKRAGKNVIHIIGPAEET